MGISCDFHILVCLDFLRTTRSNQKEIRIYAEINDTKVESAKGINGFCPICGSEFIPKCGIRKINHWAYKGPKTCDPWWEPETDWHRSWKNKFP
jgi:competence CoiA-like predicted nuclease